MGDVKIYLNTGLTSIINKLDVLVKSNHCNDDLIFSEYIKLKNQLIKNIKDLYNDDNIKFDIKYELSKHDISTITFKALNNFTYYLLQGYDYKIVKEMNITGDDMVNNQHKIYNEILDNNFRKHEL